MEVLEWRSRTLLWWSEHIFTRLRTSKSHTWCLRRRRSTKGRIWCWRWAIRESYMSRWRCRWTIRKPHMRRQLRRRSRIRTPMLRRNLTPIPRILRRKQRLIRSLLLPNQFLRLPINLRLSSQLLLTLFSSFSLPCCPPFRHALGSLLRADARFGVCGWRVCAVAVAGSICVVRWSLRWLWYTITIRVACCDIVNVHRCLGRQVGSWRFRISLRHIFTIQNSSRPFPWALLNPSIRSWHGILASGRSASASKRLRRLAIWLTDIRRYLAFFPELLDSRYGVLLGSRWASPFARWPIIIGTDDALQAWSWGHCKLILTSSSLALRSPPSVPRPISLSILEFRLRQICQSNITSSSLSQLPSTNEFPTTSPLPERILLIRQLLRIIRVAIQISFKHRIINLRINSRPPTHQRLLRRIRFGCRDQIQL